MRTLYIGCYTNGSSQGLQKISFNASTGSFDRSEVIQEISNPSFIINDQQAIYTASEVSQSENPELFCISNSKVSSLPILGDHPCHLAKHEQLGLLASSQYSSGSIDIFKLNETGIPQEKLTTIRLEGSSINKGRQGSAHAHQAVFLESRPLLASVDLGSDKVRFFSTETFELEETITLPAGSGPRHMVFNQDESLAYILCELTEELVVAKRDHLDWKIVQQIELLPNSETGEAAAAIKMSNDGRFLYTSSRAQSKISLFEVDPNTDLVAFKNAFDSQGDFPRDFELVADGEWLITANQRSNNLASFKVNKETGELNFSGHTIDIGAPVCISEVL
ncbi:lactonase family protein [Vibrio ishigakensis]|nr:lactonase family protein [Vibrio ishigakensis]